MSLLDGIRAAAEAETWDYVRQPEIEGVVLAVDPNRSSEFTARYTAVTVRTDAGKVLVIHAYHGVLADELRKLSLQTGDLLAVVYSGKRTKKDGKGRPFHHYVVAHEPIGPRRAELDMPDLPGDLL